MNPLTTVCPAWRVLPAGVFFLLSTAGALAQTPAPRPRADTLRTQRLGDVQVSGEPAPVSKTDLSAEATASPAAVTLVGREYVAPGRP